MISIITAIYNQLEMNKLFYESLIKYTKNKFELIIVDNNSNDGSREYFENKGAKVILNNGNYSYPYCQNRGIEAANFDYLFFLNNDIIVSKDWDARAIKVMKENNLDIATCSATELLENAEKSHANIQKWKLIKNPLIYFFGNKKWVLKTSFKLMYENWEQWTDNRYNEFGNKIILGIAGSNVLATRKGLEKIGNWDERIQAADFDIFLKTKKRSIEYNDIKPIHILLGIYLHHYSKLTFKKKYPPFIDRENLISVKDKWGLENATDLLVGTDMKVN